MKNRNHRTGILALLFLLFLGSVSCFNLNRISLYNLSSQYDNTLFTEFDAQAFVSSDPLVKVYVPVNMMDFASGENEVNGVSYRQFELSYSLFQSYDSKDIVDSASVVITDSAMITVDTLVELHIPFPGKERYILKLELTDLNRIDAVEGFLPLDLTTLQSRDHFLMRDVDGEIMFSNVIRGGDDFFLQIDDKACQSLQVRYYNRDFPFALPPFLEETESSFDYTADSLFGLDMEDGRSELITLVQEGFYHFQKDTSQRAGFTVFRFYNAFPNIVSPQHMLYPLRYITTRDEYAELEQAENKKLAIDNFWIGNAGNPGRARAMIKKYYGRVEDANRYFTSYLEGWKTDRGLIYIVYGPPQIVYRTRNSEEWLYGEKGHSNSIRFRFVRVDNPFTGNDYSLIKSPSYKEKWYNIVNSWRR